MTKNFLSEPKTDLFVKRKQKSRQKKLDFSSNPALRIMQLSGHSFVQVWNKNTPNTLLMLCLQFVLMHYRRSEQDILKQSCRYGRESD